MILKLITMLCPLVGIQQYEQIKTINIRTINSIEVSHTTMGCNSYNQSISAPDCTYYEPYLEISTNAGNIIYKGQGSFSLKNIVKSKKQLLKFEKNFKKQMIRCLK